MIAGTHKMVSVQHSCKSAMTHDCDDVDAVKAFNCHLRRIKIRSSSEAVCLFAKMGSVLGARLSHTCFKLISLTCYVNMLVHIRSHLCDGTAEVLMRTEYRESS